MIEQGGTAEMNTGMPTDEVTDAIAYIEMHRQEIAREAGVPAACAQALRQLQELLEQERQALQPGNDGLPANVDAVTNEINRVKSMAHGNNQARHSNRTGSTPGPGQQQTSRRNRSRNSGRNQGRGAKGRPAGR
jgi:bacterioferritin-associated ferredoxin